MDNVYSREIAAGVDIDTLNRLRIFLGGAGNTGSHFVERAVRNMIKNMFIVDNDKEGYQPHNFAHSSTLLVPSEDVGKPKAETLAARANEKLLTGGKYVGKTMNVFDVGPEFLRQFDIALGFFDNKKARAYLSRIAREANVPFMEIGLSGDGSWQCQLFDHSEDAPCYCCDMGKQTLAQSCAYNYFKDISNGIAPATDVSGAASAAFAMQAIMKFFGKEGFPCNEKFVFEAKTLTLQRWKTVKNPTCPVCSTPDEPTSKQLTISGSVDTLTYAGFMAKAEKEIGGPISICIPQRFVTIDYCPKCGRKKILMRPEHRISMSDVVCPSCVQIPGEPYLSLHNEAMNESYVGFDPIPEDLQNLTLFELGFPHGPHIYAIDHASNDYTVLLSDNES
jgi:molybdopterin/thiamine biosynthesis adenylyltransferase